MSLENSLERIRASLFDRYRDNLAAILIFGSANTGNFIEGKSDIDTILLLKKRDKLNLEKETEFLLKTLKSENFATQYFNTVNGLKKYIRKRTSFSTYITIIAKDGSRVLYSTPEFERTKTWLVKHPPS